ncbi:hypothetical protein FRC04_005519 [Tulasnella sp. 424]|nr:hypothetical protein FRC04_005519 [Tulasnella sp. 424]
MLSKTQAFALLAALTATGVQAQSGTGVTTRYWDCCKTSCAWTGKASVNQPVKTCDKNNNPLSDPSITSGCDGGTAFACANDSPWAVNDQLAYGFAAVNLSGQTESTWCCSCYQLTFTSGPVAGKTMIVQATNTGGDVGGSQFDIMIPGGGVGAFPQGCINQYGSTSGWGQQYGGVSSRDQCSSFPSALQAGCQFRFDWFEGADNPNVTWQKVTCPAAIVNVSGCLRTGESTNNGPSITAGTTTTTSTTSSTSRATTTTTTTTTTGSSSGGTAAHYAQCGGTGYSGPTVCASPYTCTYSNAYYSQCL